ncbi:type II toxin-antitoxin system RelE/ParE family toxin [Verminephrobacter aporrectodeae]
MAHLYKKRVAHAGGGKRGGYRTGPDRQPVRVPAWVPEEHHGERSRRAGRQALQYTGRVFLDLSAAARVKALQAGALLEVHCGEQDH